MTSTPGDVLNINRVLDDGPVGGMLIRVGILCAAVALLDGSDTTSIGAAAPAMVEGLGLSQSHLGPIFSSALFGALVGSVTFGPLADRYGRKRMLVIATLIFGAFTAATAVTNSFGLLLTVRFLAGIGLGGAAPCFIALASEYAPTSHRTTVTTLIWTAFPLGVILGAILNGYLLSHSTWRSVFIVGGILPIAISFAIMMWLPESIRFLLVKKPRSKAINRIAARIVPTLPANTRIVADEKVTERTPISDLFSNGRALDTMLVWLAFLAAFGTTAATFFWSPVLLHNHGLSLATASVIVGVGGGFGSLFGAAAAGPMMEKFGSVTVLAVSLFLGAISVSLLGYAADVLAPSIIVCVINGLLIAGVGTTGMLAMSANIYPVAIRSTGVGWGMGSGRFGEVVVPLLVGVLMTASGGMGVSAFMVIALVPLIGAAAILLLGRRSAQVRMPSVSGLSQSGSL